MYISIVFISNGTSAENAAKGVQIPRAQHQKNFRLVTNEIDGARCPLGIHMRPHVSGRSVGRSVGRTINDDDDDFTILVKK